MATADYETETPTRTHRGEIAEPLDAVSLDAVGTAVAEPLETDADPLATDVAPRPDESEAHGGRLGGKWRHGLDYPVLAWIVIVHAGGAGRPIFLHLEGARHRGLSGLAHRQHRRLHGLSPPVDARQFLHLPADSPAVCPHRRAIGRGFGPDVGGQSSQASYVQRQGGGSAFAARRQVVEPYPVVHAGPGRRRIRRHGRALCPIWPRTGACGSCTSCSCRRT